MSEGEALPGHCLCGAVRFLARPQHAEMDACHCGVCRRWSGGSWLTVACDPAIEIKGDVGIYRSSDHAECAFCKVCGTSLYWRMRDDSLLTVSAQAFEQPERFTFATEIFIDKKPANYSFANETKKLTEAEVLAQFPYEADRTG